MQRYDCTTFLDGGVMEPDPNGEYVRYEDVEAMAAQLADLIKEIEHQDAAMHQHAPDITIIKEHRHDETYVKCRDCGEFYGPMRQA